MAYSKSERDEALVRLRGLVKPGTTIYTILRHRSRSGMSRSISTILHENEGGDGPFDFTWLTARALDMRIDQNEGGVKIGGCGMDMGFALVYDLSRTLFPDGYGCVGKKCPSNDHSNGDRDYTPHNQPLVDELKAAGVISMVAANHWHKDGGYAIRHRWL